MWHLEATSAQFNNINDILNDEQCFLQSCRSQSGRAEFELVEFQ